MIFVMFSSNTLIPVLINLFQLINLSTATYQDAHQNELKNQRLNRLMGVALNFLQKFINNAQM